MRIKHLLWWLLLFALLGYSLPVNALGPPYAKSFENMLGFIISKKPVYTWGGFTLEKGVDCSGYVGLAAKWAGMPTKRSTARRMALGLDGWLSTIVPSNSRCKLDLGYIQFKPTRPDGHVVVYWKDVDHITHASSGRNRVVVDKFSPYFQKHLTKVRRLTFGDKK